MLRLDPSSNDLPKRSQLQRIPNAPKDAAWFWGSDDELGRLNLLTPDRSAAAAKLVQTGEVVNLDFRLDLPNPSVFGRKALKHTVVEFYAQGHDDNYEMNTQGSSQWDGFRHVGIGHDGKFIYYNNTTRQDIFTSPKIGIAAWANHGIVGRGVFLDYWSYANQSYDPFTTYRIGMKELRACAKAQKVDFQYGDIIIIRTGWIDAYSKMEEDQRQALGVVENLAHEFVGIDQTEEAFDFFHDNYFSAVAGDCPSFEAWPPNEGLSFHEVFLALWGLPIGELWDLEKLSSMCKKTQRYTFLLTSSPANVIGGVASSPNALAIF